MEFRLPHVSVITYRSVVGRVGVERHRLPVLAAVPHLEARRGEQPLQHQLSTVDHPLHDVGLADDVLRPVRCAEEPVVQSTQPFSQIVHFFTPYLKGFRLLDKYVAHRFEVKKKNLLW